MSAGIYITSDSGVVRITILTEPDHMLISCGPTVARQFLVNLYRAINEAETFTHGSMHPLDIGQEMKIFEMNQINEVTRKLMADIPEPPDDSPDGWHDFSGGRD